MLSWCHGGYSQPKATELCSVLNRLSIAAKPGAVAWWAHVPEHVMSMSVGRCWHRAAGCRYPGSAPLCSGRQAPRELPHNARIVVLAHTMVHQKSMSRCPTSDRGQQHLPREEQVSDGSLDHHPSSWGLGEPEWCLREVLLPPWVRATQLGVPAGGEISISDLKGLEKCLALLYGSWAIPALDPTVQISCSALTLTLHHGLTLLFLPVGLLLSFAHFPSSYILAGTGPRPLLRPAPLSCPQLWTRKHLSQNWPLVLICPASALALIF